MRMMRAETFLREGGKALIFKLEAGKEVESISSGYEPDVLPGYTILHSEHSEYFIRYIPFVHRWA